MAQKTNPAVLQFARRGGFGSRKKMTPEQARELGRRAAAARWGLEPNAEIVDQLIANVIADALDKLAKASERDEVEGSMCVDEYVGERDGGGAIYELRPPTQQEVDSACRRLAALAEALTGRKRKEY